MADKPPTKPPVSPGKEVMKTALGTDKSFRQRIVDSALDKIKGNAQSLRDRTDTAMSTPESIKEAFSVFKARKLDSAERNLLSGFLGNNLGNAIYQSRRADTGTKYTTFKNTFKAGVAGGLGRYGIVGELLGNKLRKSIKYPDDPQEEFERNREQFSAAHQEFVLVNKKFMEIDKFQKQVVTRIETIEGGLDKFGKQIKNIDEKISRNFRDQSKTIEDLLLDVKRENTERAKERAKKEGFSEFANDNYRAANQNFKERGKTTTLTSGGLDLSHLGAGAIGSLASRLIPFIFSPAVLSTVAVGTIGAGAAYLLNEARKQLKEKTNKELETELEKLKAGLSDFKKAEKEAQKAERKATHGPEEAERVRRLREQAERDAREKNKNEEADVIAIRRKFASAKTDEEKIEALLEYWDKNPSQAGQDPPGILVSPSVSGKALQRYRPKAKKSNLTSDRNFVAKYKRDAANDPNSDAKVRKMLEGSEFSTQANLKRKAPARPGRGYVPSFDEQMDRYKVDQEKSRFLQYGQLPSGFEFLPGHMGRLGSPEAVAARGAQPLSNFGFAGNNFSSENTGSISAPTRRVGGDIGGIQDTPGITSSKRVGGTSEGAARKFDPPMKFGGGMLPQAQVKDNFKINSSFADVPAIEGNIPSHMQRRISAGVETPAGKIVDRSYYDKFLSSRENMAALAARAQIEVGSQSRAQLKWIESALNRGESRNLSIMDSTNNTDGYYPRKDNNRWENLRQQYMKNGIPPHLEEKIIAAWKHGTNVSRGATGNESGKVQSGGAPIYASADGERYVLEARDRKWKPKFKDMPSELQQPTQSGAPIQAAPPALKDRSLTAYANNPELIKYTNQQASRNLKVDSLLETRIKTAVKDIWGPGYKAEIYSGGQGVVDGQRSKGNVGSFRHNAGKAADLYVVGPDGKKVMGDELAKLGQYWKAKKWGGIGMQMRGGGIHVDLHSGNWNYANKGGSYTKGMHERIEAGKKGELPELYKGAQEQSTKTTPPKLFELTEEQREKLIKAFPEGLHTVTNPDTNELNPEALQVLGINQGQTSKQTQSPFNIAPGTPDSKFDKFFKPGEVNMNPFTPEGLTNRVKDSLGIPTYGKLNSDAISPYHKEDQKAPGIAVDPGKFRIDGKHVSPSAVWSGNKSNVYDPQKPTVGGLDSFKGTVAIDPNTMERRVSPDVGAGIAGSKAVGGKASVDDSLEAFGGPGPEIKPISPPAPVAPAQQPKTMDGQGPIEKPPANDPFSFDDLKEKQPEQKSEAPDGDDPATGGTGGGRKGGPQSPGGNTDDSSPREPRARNNPETEGASPGSGGMGSFGRCFV